MRKIKRKVKFNIDRKNRCVVCVLECDLGLNDHPAWDSIQEEFFNKNFPYIDWRGRFTVKAKARCGENDTFDEQAGRDIALGRAEAKMYRTAGRVYSLCAKGLEKMAKACINSAMTYAANSISRTDDVNEILKKQ